MREFRAREGVTARIASFTVRFLIAALVFAALSSCSLPQNPATTDTSDSKLDYATPRVETPVFSLAGNTYGQNIQISISCPTSGAVIRYSTTGAAPDASSPIFANPIPIAGNDTVMTIMAHAVASAMLDSEVISATYTIKWGQADPPQFSVVPRTYDADPYVSLSCPTAEAIIHYTTDGTPATAASPIYVPSPGKHIPIGIGQTVVINAIAIVPSWVVPQLRDSSPASGTYRVRGWVPIGSPGFSEGTAESTSLDFDSNGMLYAAFKDYVNGCGATVMKYTEGDGWQPVGEPNLSHGVVFSTSLSIGAGPISESGVPYLAFVDVVNGSRGTVMTYSAASGWQPLGGTRGSVTSSPVIAVVLRINQGVPYVAYPGDTSTDEYFNKAYLLQYLIGSWKGLGTVSLPVSAAAASIAPVSSKIVYVAFQDPSKNYRATVMRYEVKLLSVDSIIVGTAGFSSGEARFISTALDPGGTPYVIFRDMTKSGKALVMKKPASTNWQTVGSSGFSAGAISDTSITFAADGTPYVAYRDWGNGSRITVMAYK